MKKLLIGLAVGAFVGGVTALLLAPQSGSSTRRKVRRSLEDIGDTLNDAAEYVKDQAEKLSREAQRLIEGSRSQFDGVLDAAQEYAKATGSRVTDQASRLM